MRLALLDEIASPATVATSGGRFFAVQADGTCWVGGTEWQGHTAMRISVSSWATTDDDVEHSQAAMVRLAEEVRRTRANAADSSGLSRPV